MVRDSDGHTNCELHPAAQPSICSELACIVVGFQVQELSGASHAPPLPLPGPIPQRQASGRVAQRAPRPHELSDQLQHRLLVHIPAQTQESGVGHCTGARCNSNRRRNTRKHLEPKGLPRLSLPLYVPLPSLSIVLSLPQHKNSSGMRIMR